MRKVEGKMHPMAFQGVIRNTIGIRTAAHSEAAAEKRMGYSIGAQRARNHESGFSLQC